ncbi:hypothetical protein J6590_060736 [Homalodisca vitripennis]|nr:hypothetical protein J6590_060736 [Homalodisca vitripennis]
MKTVRLGEARLHTATRGATEELCSLHPSSRPRLAPSPAQARENHAAMPEEAAGVGTAAPGREHQTMSIIVGKLAVYSVVYSKHDTNYKKMSYTAVGNPSLHHRSSVKVAYRYCKVATTIDRND